MTRPGTPRPLMMAVATASVGLRIAPSATPQPNPRPGMSQTNNGAGGQRAQNHQHHRQVVDRGEAPRRKYIAGIDFAEA